MRVFAEAETAHNQVGGSGLYKFLIMHRSIPWEKGWRTNQRTIADHAGAEPLLQAYFTFGQLATWVDTI